MTDPDQLPAPFPPNESGSTQCIVRWMVTLKGGLWLGAYDKESFDSYALTAIATERARADALQEKFNCADLMAQCMAGLREDCIEAGVVDESVPPMMYPEEIIPRLVRADALEAALSDVLEMAQEHADHFAAAFAGYKPERHAYYARALATARALLNQKE